MPPATNKAPAYDPACKNLAEYFLGNGALSDAVTDLAATIQQSVEDWFQSIEMEMDEYIKDRMLKTPPPAKNPDAPKERNAP